MTTFVQRTVSELDREGPVPDRQRVSLNNYRSTAAWVLLGDPGSGKTHLFRHEAATCEERGERAEYITARDFLALGDCNPAWRDTTLFIDAFDEVRAGTHQNQRPLDRIRRHLFKLGRPKFRISCRDADWLGEIDRIDLAKVSKNSNLVTLQLDGLDDAQLNCYLKVYDPTINIEDFIAKARTDRVDSFLKNPQSLHMMVQLAKKQIPWPSTRLALFMTTCEHSTIEHNPHHRTPDKPILTRSETLDIAGRVCALQLLTDRLECMPTTSTAHRGALMIRDFPFRQHKVIRQALATKLFTSGPNGGRIPVHRNIADFLAASHLSRLINEGLPVQRILALITGHDGIVVTPFRGLSAWLATHSTIARPTMIASDPVGVALYGDLTCFSRNQQKLLIRELLQRLTVQTDTRHLATICARIPSAAINSILKEHLMINDRSDRGLRITKFILEMLFSIENLKPFASLLLEIVENINRPYDIKTLALKAFLHNHNYNHHPDEIKRLLTLLERTREQTFDDPEAEITGELLSYLYPRHLPASNIIAHLHNNAPRVSDGSYYRFWKHGILERSHEADAAIILDQLAMDFGSKNRSIRRYTLYELPFDLLLQVLKASNDTITIDQLYKWSRMILSIMRYRPNLAREQIDKIKRWFESRPHITMGLVDLAFEMGISREHHHSNYTEIDEILLGASPPHEFGSWCLNKALLMSTDRPKLAVDLLLRCYEEFSLREHESGLTLDSIKRAAKHVGYDRPLERARSQPNVDHEWNNRVSKERHDWITRIRSDVGRLSAESDNAQVLHVVGRAYFGLIHELDAERGFAAIYELLENDMHLIEPLSQSMLHVHRRRDIPSVAEIVGLFAKQKRHILGLPFLACADCALREDAIDRKVWNTEQVGRAVAFYYAEPYLPQPTAGFRSLVNSNPEATIKVLVQMMLVDIRARRGVPWKSSSIVELLSDQDLMRRASLEIASHYPLKCTTSQVEVLDPHIWRILSSDQPSLRQVVAHKLSRTTLGIGQRVRWMTVSVLLGSDSAVRDYVDFITATPRRLVHFTTFLRTIAYANYSKLFACLHMLDTQKQVRIVDSMLRILAGYSSPSDRFRSGWIDSKIDMSALVSLLMEFLSTIASFDAGRVLGDLSKDPRFSSWSRILQFHSEVQSEVVRDASFVYATVEDANSVLENGLPASSADLFGLVLNCLDSIRELYRGDDANRWRAFWSENSFGKPIRPKAENSCRDGLLYDLRQRLPKDIHVEAERHTVFDSRVDILASYRDFAVPLEIKKYENRSVWTGIREQLMKKYVRNQSTSGYGIYVVLWFGRSGTNSSENRDVSGNLDDTRNEIIRRAGLTDSERRKIAVVVFDLSVPRLSSA